jgi:hypothetical protein
MGVLDRFEQWVLARHTSIPFELIEEDQGFEYAFQVDKLRFNQSHLRIPAGAIYRAFACDCALKGEPKASAHFLWLWLRRSHQTNRQNREMLRLVIDASTRELKEYYASKEKGVDR